jgi:uncharacterized membrane protein YidH (DUF202 family)
MALATRPKPSTHAKKRRAQHHRSKSKHYVKPYLPYLPMLLIVVIGLAINSLWPPASALAVSAAPDGRPVSRIELMTGGQEWALLAVVTITGVAFALLIVRHSYYLRKAINRGEYWVVHHPWIDVAVTLVVVAGVLLTRTGGTY